MHRILHRNNLFALHTCHCMNQLQSLLHNIEIKVQLQNKNIQSNQATYHFTSLYFTLDNVLQFLFVFNDSHIFFLFQPLCSPFVSSLLFFFLFFLLTAHSSVLPGVQDKIESVMSHPVLIPSTAPVVSTSSNSRALVQDQSTNPTVTAVNTSVPPQPQSTSMSMTPSAFPLPLPLPLPVPSTAASHPVLVPSASAHNSGIKVKLMLHMTKPVCMYVYFAACAYGKVQTISFILERVSVCLSEYLSACASVCLCVRLPAVCLSVCLFICLCIYLSIYLYSSL